MANLDVFLPLLTYPKPTTRAAIEAVVHLAESFSQLPAFGQSHREIRTSISALILETEIEAGLDLGSANICAIQAAEAGKSAANAHALHHLFQDATTHQPLLARCRIERRTRIEGIQLLVEEARLHRVTAFALGKDNAIHQDIAEHLIFESGRPILIFPDEPVRPLPKTFENIAVAWDGSRASSRAVGDAMPLLLRALHVHFFSASDDKPMRAAQRGREIADQLVREGVDATYENIKKIDAHTIGNFIEGYLGDHAADLLVMGAFSHSRLREFFLGGATRSILMNPPGWVIVSH